MNDIHGTAVRLTANHDGGGGWKDFSAFLSQSRSGRALVSNVVTHEDGSRRLLVYVRKLDGELALMATQLDEGISRKAVVKIMRDAGVKVENLPGPITIVERFPIH